LKYLNDRLVSYFTTLLPPPPLDSLEASTGSSDLFVEGCPLSWKLSVCTQPIYLIGRYRKLSREISQAKWTLTEENEDYDEDCDPRSKGSDDLEQKQKDFNVIGNANETFDSNDKLKSVRKGKMSVEEIVCEAVNHAMKAKISRLHPWCVGATFD
jgi:tRNA U54 and U55 pseudouridine synthase Pus10